MGIAKFDDGILDNPKHAKAGPTASWLWFCSILSCRRGLTDGFIPKAKVPGLIPDLANPFRHASRLVEVGLWHEAVGGYVINDYLDWNPSKLTVEDYRRRDKARKAVRHPERIPDGNPTRNPDRNPDRNPSDHADRARDAHAGAKSESEKKSESKDQALGEESAREGAIARPGQNPHHKPTNLVNGADQRRHGTHAWCDYERGLCVPYSLHDEFTKRARKTEAELKAWYAGTVQSVAGVDVGDSIFDFWRNQFAAWVGTVTAKPSHRRAGVTESNLRGLRDDLSELEDAPGGALMRES